MIDEGYIKFALDWERGPAPPAAWVGELRRWRKPLYAQQLIGHYEDLGIGYGNISVRAPADGHFLISGTQTGHLDDPGPAHYALVTAYDIDANRVTARGAVKASSESMTHAALYELSDDINAVVHVHSRPLWQQLMHRLPTTRDDIAYGTPQMAQEFGRLWSETDFPACGIAIMAGHEEGIVGIGHSMAEAARRILALTTTE